ncbi:ABC transporter permease [Palleniella muris]|uniref:ABC transporter permease n=1 Tax=Palleniella muris TaxID=3038145 RepID=A0AC61QS82_9BACT|nr:ABC transporter permease [Palleniella muris]TGX83158.1 ABC transporter permease [Palleniella muris]
MNRSFIAFVRKEVTHIVRDPRTMLIALLIPVVQMILFGFAISTELNDVEVVVATPKMTPAIESKVAQMAQNPYITFRGYITTDKVDHCLSSNEALAVVVFSRDYDRNGKFQIVADASNTTTAQTATGYLTNILSESKAAVAPNVRILFNPQLKSSYNFVPGIMGLIFILICAMLTSVSIVREKETGTMEVLLVSPIRPVMIVVAKMIPYFALACIDLVSILLISRYALDVPLSGSMTALFALSFVYIILALALGLFVSTLVESQMAALLISGMVFMMPVIMLSGMMFPIENMPTVLQWVSNIVPARWYIPAMRKIMIEGLGFGYVAKEGLVLTFMAVALVAISVKRFNNRLQ